MSTLGIVEASLTTLQRYRRHAARFVEIDILRSCAIIFMVVLHVSWDLDYFGLFPLNKGIYQFQVLVPTLFFILAGICLVFTTTQKKMFLDHNHSLEKHLLIRGLWIFGLGMIITVVTLVFMPDRPIFFGVLHCIGLSIIMCIPFLRLRSYNFVFAAGIIFLSTIMGSYIVEQPTLLHMIVGIHPASMAKVTIDYFPIFPWFGVILFGIALGNVLYKDGRRRFPCPDLSRYKRVNAFSWLGKHSLGIYLVHQPIIAGILGGYLFLSKII